MQAEGIGGEVKHGYAVAARLDHWRLSPADTGHVVVTDLSGADRYLIQRTPLTLILRLGKLSWTWENVKLNGGRLLVEGRPVEGVKVLHGT